jgi:hypothetical protein
MQKIHLCDEGISKRKKHLELLWQLQLPLPFAWVAWGALKKSVLCLFQRRFEHRDHFGKVKHENWPCRAATGTSKGRYRGVALASCSAQNQVHTAAPQ